MRSTVSNSTSRSTRSAQFGQPAQFSFVPGGGLAPYTFVPELRPDEGYAISFRTAPIVTFPPVYGINVNLCDFGAKLKGSGKAARFNGCRTATDPAAYENPLITNPTRCSGPPPAQGLRVNSWEHPAEIKTKEAGSAADHRMRCGQIRTRGQTDADQPPGRQPDRARRRDRDADRRAVSTTRRRPGDARQRHRHLPQGDDGQPGGRKRPGILLAGPAEVPLQHPRRVPGVLADRHGRYRHRPDP